MSVAALFRRLTALVRNAQHLPRALKLAIEMVEAHEEVARQDYVSAEARLHRIFAMGLPDHVIGRSTAKLLMALVSLRLGKPGIAAGLIPDAVHDIGAIRTYANPVERAYLKYAGRLILEEATDVLGESMTLDVGVDYEDLDVTRVRNAIRLVFPVYRSRHAPAPRLQ
ncbi:MAG: hypothetical protein FD125_1555 [bacterium]|nr:MAG: hypothetical protein FD125_1555 [bacterium]